MDNPKWHIYSKRELPVANSHSMLKENYEASWPTRDLGEVIIVSSLNPPLKWLPSRETEISTEYKKGDLVRISVLVCFGNRGRENSVSFVKKSDSVKKLMELAGLSKANGYQSPTSKLYPPKKEKKFSIGNRFEISGVFEVKDEPRFKNALRFGVGSRKTYGHGLLFVERIRDED